MALGSIHAGCAKKFPAYIIVFRGFFLVQHRFSVCIVESGPPVIEKVMLQRMLGNDL